jgi:hypothetical protein
MVDSELGERYALSSTDFFVDASPLVSCLEIVHIVAADGDVNIPFDTHPGLPAKLTAKKPCYTLESKCKR